MAKRHQTVKCGTELAYDHGHLAGYNGWPCDESYGSHGRTLTNSEKFQAEYNRGYDAGCRARKYGKF